MGHEWFIDIHKNIYSISTDTKVLSKILELHLFPEIVRFAEEQQFAVVLPQHQNYYPDISFISKKQPHVKYAMDFKTTYRIPGKPWLCNGFTLGSHGKYFRDRHSRKNIQFPYSAYSSHFCLGIIYDRTEDNDILDMGVHQLADLRSMASVIANLHVFVAEKWTMASDKRGSGNTANIGSIKRIEDIISGNGMFAVLGEGWFDDYWMNYGNIINTSATGEVRKITSLRDFVLYGGGDVSAIVEMNNRE